MSTSSPYEMAAEDVDALRRARHALENPGLAARISNFLGLPIDAAIKSLPTTWSAVIHRATQRSLMAALDTALRTVRRGQQAPPQDRFHQVAVGAAGAVGGFFGLPALAIELPVSTAVMLRSIADIARSEGERLDTIDAKLACIEVFALGGPTGLDDASESAYYAVRAALATAVAEAATHFAATGGAKSGAPVVVRMIAQIASRFGVTVTQKVAAQAVPVVGAAGGATVNVLFITHFQAMAGGHFTVRRLERKYGAELVQARYQQL